MESVSIRCTQNEKEMVMKLADELGISVNKLIIMKLGVAYGQMKIGNFSIPEIKNNKFDDSKKTQTFHSRITEALWKWVNLEANCKEISTSSVIRYIIFNEKLTDILRNNMIF